MSQTPINAVLVCGGKYHDFNLARLEILKILFEDERVRVRVFEDYSNLEAIREAAFIVSYTCDVRPTLAQQEALRDYVAGGGRWYALHGTNGIIEFVEGRVDTPDLAPLLMEVLGSRFVAHPPAQRFRVDNMKPDHPIVRGVESFETEDEIYLSQYRPGVEVLLATEFEGKGGGYVVNDFPHAHYPVLYLHKLGEGEVLFLTLGHCNGHYDQAPLRTYVENTSRCSWDTPMFYELLRRGVAWAKQPQEALAKA